MTTLYNSKPPNQQLLYPLFLRTLRSTGGASTAAGVFFLAARTPALIFFFLPVVAIPAVVDFSPFFIIVVAVDPFDALLVLLTERFPTGTCTIPRFDLVAIGFTVAGGLVALRPVLALACVGLALSFIMLVKLAVAVITVAFAGEADLSAIGFSGEAGREM